MHLKISAFILLFAGFVAAAATNASAADAAASAPPAGDQAGPACSESICWGMLVVPFKAELTENQDVFGSATVGPYVGWEFGDSVRNLTPIVFVGYSQNIGASGAGANSSFVSYGTGFLVPVDFSQKLEFGVVLGFDHTGNSNHFVYNDKPWVSALIGVNLN